MTLDGHCSDSQAILRRSVSSGNRCAILWRAKPWLNISFAQWLETFRISPKAGRPRETGLWLDDELLGSYQSPEAAADDVYVQVTGHHAWDTLKNANPPIDLSGWQRRQV